MKKNLILVSLVITISCGKSSEDYLNEQEKETIKESVYSTVIVLPNAEKSPQPVGVEAPAKPIDPNPNQPGPNAEKSPQPVGVEI